MKNKQTKDSYRWDSIVDDWLIPIGFLGGIAAAIYLLIYYINTL